MATEIARAPGEVACPDPSVHEHHKKTSEHASTAALLAHTDRTSKDNVLGPDGKLSTSSAAQSLKYAKARDLPSFPVRGSTNNAALAAASLAKDYSMKELWQPEMSAAGSKAAVKAHREGGSLNLWQPTASSAGNSAANIAMRNKGLSPNIDRGYTENGRNHSLVAATKSHHSNRQRADSTPVPAPAKYPDAQNSTRNALNAASTSHRAVNSKAAPDGWDSEANQAARIKNVGNHMDRNLFTEHPSIEPDIAERKHQAAMRASAVSMAKQMMEIQNRAGTPTDNGSTVGSAGAGAGTAHRRNQSSTSGMDVKAEALRYIHLQDAAHKVAQDRLATIDKDLDAERYREYYGYGNKSPKKSRLSVAKRGRTRKRASSEGQYFEDSDDEEQARRIRTQMSQLSTAQNTVDDRKREEDRARLLAAAEKRVHARMHDMDEKVYLDTGKMSQAMLEEWEAKMRERAEKERAEREVTTGRTHIGGGKYMDRSEIEAIAAARLQPTLDEINENAERRRARDEEAIREKDLQETAKMDKKMRAQNLKEEKKMKARQIKDEDDELNQRKKEQRARDLDMDEEIKENERKLKMEFKKIKEQDKAAAKKEKEERKAAQKAEKEQEKARKAEEKRKNRDPEKDRILAMASGPALARFADKPKEKQEPTADSREEEKAGNRGMFGKFADKFKRHDEDEDLKKPIEERERPVIDATEAGEKHDDGTAAEAVPIMGAGLAAAGGIEEEHATKDEHEETVSAESSDGGVDRTAAAAALIGVGGAGTAAGVAFGRSREAGGDNEPEVSSLSSEDRDEFETPEVANNEHTGHYTFATGSPTTQRRKPDLERHISTIESGSDNDDDGDDEREDSDDGYFEDSAGIGRIDNTSPVYEMREEAEGPATRSPTGAPEPRTLASLFPTDEHGNIVIVNSAAGPEAPHLHITENPPDGRKSVESATAARLNSGDEEHADKRRSGINGVIDKIVPPIENKLHKRDKSLARSEKTDRTERTRPSEDHAEIPVANLRDDNIIPVTTTSAGVAEHEGRIDGTVGETQKLANNGAGPSFVRESQPVTGRDTGVARDRQPVTGLGAAARDDSPSSFRRNREDLDDLDDVSSSGKEEEDVLASSRGGRPAGVFSFLKGRQKPADRPQVRNSNNNVSNSEVEDEFQEARDTFDESLAPPPGFAGQAKNGGQSPIRDTRFKEQF